MSNPSATATATATATAFAPDLKKAEHFTLVSDDQVSLAVISFGKTDAEPVVICNAAGMPVELLFPLMNQLASRYRVYTWACRLLPGHASHTDEMDVSVDRHLADGLRVCRHADPHGHGVHLIGWCTGARLASMLASTGSARVLSLALLNGSFADDALPRTAFERNMRRVVPKMATSPRIAEMFRQMMLNPQPSQGAAKTENFGTNHASEAAKALAGLPYSSGDNLYRYARLLSAFHGDDRHRLPDVHPHGVLVLTGEKDETTHPDASRAVAASLPGSVFECLEDANHFMMFENADVGEKVFAFMNSHQRAHTFS